MYLVEDHLMGDLEDAVGLDPQVQRARKIAEAARARLLACVAVAGEPDLAEAQRMMDALRKATVLAEDAEDEVRVRAGLLTRGEADRRAAARRAGLADRALPPGTLPLGRVRAPAPAPGSPRPLAVLPKNPALAVLLSLLLPGLGSAVSGNLPAGAALFGCAALSAAAAWNAAPHGGRAAMALILAAVWLVSLAAAYRDARHWNRRHGIES
ncbi:MAG TPA: hypothetical protein VKV38_10425 [Trebonia sp.]|nr:hypothetical protein [Trebonia sp.]